MNKKRFILLVSLIILSIIFTACTNQSTSEGLNYDSDKNLLVHYIDVGQGDAILIQKGNKNMLIDAGDNKYGQIVVDYLKEKGVSKLDYIIGTHPHADHIGGLDVVINSLEVEKIIMPKISNNTKTFEDLLLAIQNKGLNITTPIVGDLYELSDAQFTILAPNKEKYNNLNDYSVVIRLEYKNDSFLFAGDAEAESEEEILELPLDFSLESDVLKIGHHGSSSSTTEEFLKAVNPKTVIFQLGKDNSYGHPHRETIEKIEKNNIDIFRNDINGNIIAISDGNSIEFKMDNPTDNKDKGSSNIEVLYIGNKNSKVFHLENCQQLPAEDNRILLNSKEEAINFDYRPCQRCKP